MGWWWNLNRSKSDCSIRPPGLCLGRPAERRGGAGGLAEGQVNADAIFYFSLPSTGSNYFTEPEKARAGYQRVFSKGFVRDYPLDIRHTSGGITDVLYNASVYKDEKGSVLGVFAAARDVTERKRFEREHGKGSRFTLVLEEK